MFQKIKDTKKLRNNAVATLPTETVRTAINNIATGGDITTIDVSGVQYKVHSFINTTGNPVTEWIDPGTNPVPVSYTFNITQGISNFEYLVIGGGGSGGWSGGGAGGFLESNVNTNGATSFNITVGISGFSGGSKSQGPLPGGDSKITGTGIDILSIGGGSSFRGDYDGNDRTFRGNGGSGAGGIQVIKYVYPNYVSNTNYSSAAGVSLDGKGFRGGNGYWSGVGNANRGGGGGGAGGPGENAISTTTGNGGNGGPGKVSSITGTAITYCKGGGGTTSPLYIKFSTLPSVQNPGDGGIGGGFRYAGANGIVIIRYPSATYTENTTSYNRLI